MNNIILIINLLFNLTCNSGVGKHFTAVVAHALYCVAMLADNRAVAIV